MPKQNQIRAVHTLIHIGCGTNPNIDEYISLAEHVWLIDADTEVLDKLEEIIQAPESESYRNIHTRLALVDTEQGKATFHRYSLPWASGVTPIDEKTQRLYPGLQCLSSEEQTTIAISTLVKECLSSTESEQIDNHMLLLGCGYKNETLLQALEDSDELSRFSTVVVLPIHRHYKPIEVPPTLYAPLQPPLNFTLPSNAQILARNPLIKVIKNLKIEASRDRQELEWQLEEHRHQLNESHQQKTELDKQLSQCMQQRDKNAKEVENIANAHEALKEQLVDCNHRLAELSKERGQTQELLKDNQEALEKSKLAEKKAYHKCDEEAQRANQTASEKDVLLAELKVMQQRVGQINTELEEHNKLQLAYNEQQRSAQLNAKLLMKVEADASELRERYGKLKEREQELQNLISELCSKLESASSFYKNISQKHPELLEEL